MRAIPPNRQLKSLFNSAVRLAVIAATIFGVAERGWCETAAATSQSVASQQAPPQRASSIHFVMPASKQVSAQTKAAPETSNAVAGPTLAAPTAAPAPVAVSATPP